MLGNSRRWRFLLVSGAKTGLDGGDKRSRRPQAWLVKRIHLPSRRFLRGELVILVKLAAWCGKFRGMMASGRYVRRLMDYYSHRGRLC